MSLPLLGTLHQWNYTISVLLYLAYLLSVIFSVFIHVEACARISFQGWIIPFCAVTLFTHSSVDRQVDMFISFYCWVLFHCMAIQQLANLFICSSVGHLDYFQTLANMNKPLEWTHNSFLLGKYLRVQQLSHILVINLVHKEWPNCFKVAGNYQRIRVPHSPQFLIIACLVDAGKF